VQALAKQPLKDAAVVNSVRWAIWRMLAATNLPIEVGTGGRTKFNRARLSLPKAHWIDAACVGGSGAQVRLVVSHQPLRIKATGHGSRQMCRTDKFGFLMTHKARVGRRFGWKTGDMAKAVIPHGKYAGIYPSGRVVAKSGSFLFSPPGVSGKDRIPVNHKYLLCLHRNDGYGYE
jgi:hypothetical protein